MEGAGAPRKGESVNNEGSGLVVEPNRDTLETIFRGMKDWQVERYAAISPQKDVQYIQMTIRKMR